MTQSAPRILHFVLGGLCLGLATVIAAELMPPVEEVSASPTGTADGVETPADKSFAKPDVDGWVKEILARPLFTPGRRPPAPVVEPETVTEEEVEEPPELPGRLAGVMLRPSAREALFAREGEKPVAVGEGEDIDGWTVDSIDADQVVISNEFGQRILKPESDGRDEPAASHAPAAKKPPAPKAVKSPAPAATTAQPAVPPAMAAKPGARPNPPAQASAGQNKAPPRPAAPIAGAQRSKTSLQTGSSGVHPWGS